MSIELSSYRLGDLVLLQLNDLEKDEILHDHPNSIASEYIIETRKIKNKLNMNQKIDLITKIALKHSEKYKDLYPEDIKNSVLLHLRLGDVVSGTHTYEKSKRPLSVDYLKKIVPKNMKLYIIGKPFFAKPSSTNYEECIINSQKYLEEALTSLNGTHFIGSNADVDLCCALKSKYFIQGKGYFSKLIVEIRKKLKLFNVETNVHS